jgi:hypothetical protein
MIADRMKIQAESLFGRLEVLTIELIETISAEFGT